MAFAHVSEIDVHNDASYNQTFLTLDIDWASDDVLAYTIDFIQAAQIKATWFATHKTPLLDSIRANPLFELGIHPNFNPLLEGDFIYGKDYKAVLDYFLDIVPDAKTMRSHCLALSSRVLMQARARGITHESNLCIPLFATGGIPCLKPFINWDGFVRCPYHYADDVCCMYEQMGFTTELKFPAGGGAYFMLGVHPIHIFLNTDSLKRYESARPFFRDYKSLKAYINPGFGVRDVLISLFKEHA